MLYYWTPLGRLWADVMPVDEDFEGIPSSGKDLPVFEVVTWKWVQGELKLGNEVDIKKEFPNFDMDNPSECMVKKKDGSYVIMLKELDLEKIRNRMKQVLFQEIVFINPLTEG